MSNSRRLAVVADAHGNSVGLRAVVEDIRRTGVDETIILGDMVYGLDPAGTFDLIHALPAPRSILGNGELYLLAPPMADPPASMQAVVRAVQAGCAWMRARLGEHRLDEIRSWPEYLLEGGIFFVHDSPSDRLRKERWHDPGFPPEHQEILYHAPGLYPDRSDEHIPLIDREALERGFATVVAGHIHRFCSWQTHHAQIWTAGSAGMPMDGDPRAGWLLLELGDDNSVTSTARRVEYDVEKAVTLIGSARDCPEVATLAQRNRLARRFRNGGDV